MQVAQYLFQSPSSNPVQVGRLDPNSVKNESTKTQSLPTNVTDPTVAKAERFAASQTQKVNATVNTNKFDVYA